VSSRGEEYVGQGTICYKSKKIIRNAFRDKIVQFGAEMHIRLLKEETEKVDPIRGRKEDITQKGRAYRRNAGSSKRKGMSSENGIEYLGGARLSFLSDCHQYKNLSSISEGEGCTIFCVKGDANHCNASLIYTQSLKISFTKRH